MTDFPHTHVQIDGRVHLVVSVETHDDGPRHTHRAHLGCGLTVDTDLHGERHRAAARAHQAHARSAAGRGRHAEHAIAGEHAAAAQRAAELHAADHGEADSRWRRHEEPAADCPACAAVEAGGEPTRADAGHAAAVTVEADQHTGIRCPSCSGEIRRRRSDGAFACTGSGHEFDPADLLAQAQASFSNLIALTSGKG
jgi:hypothetical protein